MSKRMKVTLITLLFCVLFVVWQNVSFADNFDVARFDSASGNSTVNKAAKKTIGTAVNIIRIVGVGISIIMITYMAITYMLAAPQERAEFKKSAMIYVIGAILIFGGSNLLTVVTKFASEAVS